MNKEQLTSKKVLSPGESQVFAFREGIETVIVERLSLCFAELLAAHPGSWLVKHQVRSEVEPKS